MKRLLVKLYLFISRFIPSFLIRVGFKRPVYLRFGTSDMLTYGYIFWGKDYKINFDNPKIVIDLGAHIGLFALKMKKCYPNTKIICVEPDPDNYNLLQKNMKPYKNVDCEMCGIWNKDTILKVYDKFKLGKFHHWGLTVDEDLITGNIKAISMGSLLEKHGIEQIDVLKIDIETSEKQLFADNYKDWLPKVKMIVIELHDSLENGCSKSFFSAINTVFTNYKFSMQGESIIIQNLDYKN